SPTASAPTSTSPRCRIRCTVSGWPSASSPSWTPGQRATRWPSCTRAPSCAASPMPRSARRRRCSRTPTWRSAASSCRSSIRRPHGACRCPERHFASTTRPGTSARRRGSTRIAMRCCATGQPSEEKTSRRGVARRAFRCYATLRSVPSDRTARRKAQLLDAFVRYLLRRGVSDISLRPAAAALGTSPRMLIYYFGSRKRLLFDAMAEIRIRERARFMQQIERRPPGLSTREFLMASWRWYASKRREPYLRLLFELYGLAFVNPKRYRGFLTAMAEDFFGMIEAGLRHPGPSQRDNPLAATLYPAPPPRPLIYPPIHRPPRRLRPARPPGP